MMVMDRSYLRMRSVGVEDFRNLEIAKEGQLTGNSRSLSEVKTFKPVLGTSAIVFLKSFLSTPPSHNHALAAPVLVLQDYSSSPTVRDAWRRPTAALTGAESLHALHHRYDIPGAVHHSQCNDIADAFQVLRPQYEIAE